MHELSIAEEIKDLVFDELKKSNCKKINSLHLIIGEMTSIVPDALKMAFEEITKGTSMERCKIFMKVVKTKVICKSCKKKFKPEDLNFFCPHCGSFDTEVIEGRELLIKKIVME